MGLRKIFAGKRAEEKSQTAKVPAAQCDSQAKESRQLRVEQVENLEMPKKEEEKEIPAEDPIPDAKRCGTASSGENSALSDAQESKSQASHELEIECLVCEDLVHCGIRNAKSKCCVKRKQE